jgi:5'-3' exonuclease
MSSGRKLNFRPRNKVEDKSNDKPKMIKLVKRIEMPKPATTRSTTPRKTRTRASTGVKPYVFVDTSYFVFYRYHATKVWYSKHTDSGSEESCTIDNEDFVNAFTRHFCDWKGKIAKKFKVSEDDLFWFRDSPRESLWRTPLFPEYKASREDKCSPAIGSFFKLVFEKLLSNDRMIRVEGAEADDVAAIATRYEQKNSPDRDIYVLTADTDYLQLCNERTKIVKLPKFETIPVQVKLGKEKKIVSPDVYLETKILVGDASDEIPKVYVGCGPKIAYNIATDRELFKKNIESHPDRLEKYLHNRKLICFDEIPDDIKEKALARYLEVKGMTDY